MEKPKKVLVVEDVYSIRLKTELVLRHAGRYEVTSVSSGAEAIEAARANLPDVMVLDIVMDGMDGITTLSELRRHGITCPAVAYTSRKERVSGELVARGFVAYVSKTETMSGLLTVLRTLLDSGTTMEDTSRQATSLLAAPKFLAAPVR